MMKHFIFLFILAFPFFSVPGLKGNNFHHLLVHNSDKPAVLKKIDEQEWAQKFFRDEVEKVKPPQLIKQLENCWLKLKNSIFMIIQLLFLHQITVNLWVHTESGPKRNNWHGMNTAGVDPSPELTPDEAAKSYADYLQIPAATPLEFLHGIVIAEIETISGTDTTYISRLCYKIDLLDSLARNGQIGYIDIHTGKVFKTQRNWFDYSANPNTIHLREYEYETGEYYYKKYSIDTLLHVYIYITLIKGIICFSLSIRFHKQ